MANLDLLNAGIRRAVIQEIKSDENKRRKAESLKRFEVFSERQDRYIIEKLESEFSSSTVRDMRKILSVNLCPRIINSIASIYNMPPSREVSEITEEQSIAMENVYDKAKVDTKMMMANKYFKLNDQCALQYVIKNGEPRLKVLLPHQYDVLPDVDDVEKPYAYIVSVFDKFEYLSASSNTDLANIGRMSLANEHLNGRDESIADSEDYKASLERYEVWTDELNFIMNGKGEIVSGVDLDNPVNRLPFVDISGEKDSEFFVRKGNGIVQFAIDFGAQLSDVSNIIRLQGYAQAVIFAEKHPTNMVVGPNHILFMQLDPNRPELRPSFEFVNPGSDLKSALEFLEMTLRLFLTSKGIDPKTITGTGTTQSFTSGLERLLSNLDKFEATRSDLALFANAEKQLNEIILDWNDAYIGTDLLDPQYQLGKISEDANFSINFSKPESVQTKSEMEDSAIKLLDKGLMTKIDAIKIVHGVNDEIAEEMLEEIKADKELNMPVLVAPPITNEEEATEEVVTQ